MNRGGLGDQVCRLPAIRYVIQRYGYVEFTIYCPDYFLEMLEFGLSDLKENFYIRPLGEYTPPEDGGKAVPTLFINEKNVTTLKSHLVDYAFWFYADRQPEGKLLDYPRFRVKLEKDKFNLPEKYVVVATEYTAPVRQPTPELINGFSQWLVSRGITPVFLGKAENKMITMSRDGKSPPLEVESHAHSNIDFSLGLDLRGETTLLESVGIIDGALAVAGMDCGILHLAGLTDTAIIGAYTTVEPTFRLPYRHGVKGWNCYTAVPTKELACRFCQSNWHLVYNHDFRTCLYKDLLCVKDIKSTDFIQLMEKVLEAADAV
jgi:ADP-heptose:LPS heptosyltransferase